MEMRGQLRLLDTLLCPMMTDGRTCVHKKSRLLTLEPPLQFSRYDWLLARSRSYTSTHTHSTAARALEVLDDECGEPHATLPLMLYDENQNQIVISCVEKHQNSFLICLEKSKCSKKTWEDDASVFNCRFCPVLSDFVGRSVVKIPISFEPTFPQIGTSRQTISDIFQKETI